MDQPSSLSVDTGHNPLQIARNTDYFPFLDLPAELRNRCYEFMSHQVSQHIMRRGPKDEYGMVDIGVKFQVPFWHLLQTCQQIRKEFEPVHFRHHTVVLSEVETYVSAFARLSPETKPRPRDLWRQGLETLELVVDISGYIDILQVLQLKARHPECKIEVNQAEDSYEDLIAPLSRFINNKNETWLDWIRTGALQVADVHVKDPFFTLNGFGDGIGVQLALTRGVEEQWEGIGEQAKSAKARDRYLVDDRYIRDIALDIEGLKVVFVASLRAHPRR